MYTREFMRFLPTLLARFDSLEEQTNCSFLKWKREKKDYRSLSFFFLLFPPVTTLNLLYFNEVLLFFHSECHFYPKLQTLSVKRVSILAVHRVIYPNTIVNQFPDWDSMLSLLREAFFRFYDESIASGSRSERCE